MVPMRLGFWERRIGRHSPPCPPANEQTTSCGCARHPVNGGRVEHGQMGVLDRRLLFALPIQGRRQCNLVSTDGLDSYLRSMYGLGGGGRASNLERAVDTSTRPMPKIALQKRTSPTHAPKSVSLIDTSRRALLPRPCSPNRLVVINSLLVI